MMKKIIKSTTDMIDFGAKLGAELRGGEVIELIGDVGAGKTTFTKGLAKGLAIAETVQSPSFTISRVYDGRLELVHYDFYRLNNAGVMALELADNLSDAEKVVVILSFKDVIEAFNFSFVSLSLAPFSPWKRMINSLPSPKA